MSDLFNEIDTEDQDGFDPMEALKARYAKEDGSIDIDALLKSKFESDRHISTLEREAAERQKELAKQSTMDEILTKIREASTPQTPKPQAHQPSGSEEDKQSPNVEEVVRTMLAQRETQSKLETNRGAVTSGLQKAWGSEAQIKLNKRAKELGVSLQDLRELGDKSPALLFQALGVNPDEQVRPPQGAVAPRPSPLQTTGKPGVRDKAYYERMKQSDPEGWRNGKYRQQQYKDWLANPELFQ